jgi:MraZ protein
VFIGEFQYKIDDKGRVPIPPRYRKELVDGLVVMPGPEKCLSAYTPEEWKKQADRFAAASISPSKLRRLSRGLFGLASDLTLDAQGRIALPAQLRQYAGLDDEAVVVGANTTLELWNKDLWEAEKETIQDEVWQIIEGLEER